jgi:hypothetical protein
MHTVPARRVLMSLSVPWESSTPAVACREMHERWCTDAHHDGFIEFLTSTQSACGPGFRHGSRTPLESVSVLPRCHAARVIACCCLQYPS